MHVSALLQLYSAQWATRCPGLLGCPGLSVEQVTDSVTIVPNMGPGLSVTIVPIMGPGLSVTVVPNMDPGLSVTNVPIMGPGLSVTVVPIMGPGLSVTVVPWPQCWTSNWHCDSLTVVPNMGHCVSACENSVPLLWLWSLKWEIIFCSLNVICYNEALAH